MPYTVTLILPNLCEAGDWQGHADPTPVDAVESFQHAVLGSPDLWTFGVREEGGKQRTFTVDMADGPSVTEANPWEPLDEMPVDINTDTLADWCLSVIREHEDSDSDEIPRDTPEHVLQREAARLEIEIRDLTSSFIANTLDIKE